MCPMLVLKVSDHQDYISPKPPTRGRGFAQRVVQYVRVLEVAKRRGGRLVRPLH